MGPKPDYRHAHPVSPENRNKICPYCPSTWLWYIEHGQVTSLHCAHGKWVLSVLQTPVAWGKSSGNGALKIATSLWSRSWFEFLLDRRWVSVPLPNPDHSQLAVSVRPFTQPRSFPTSDECPFLYSTLIIPNQRWVSIPLPNPDHSQPAMSVRPFTQPRSFPTSGECPYLYPTPIIPNRRWVSFPLPNLDHSQPVVSARPFTQPRSFPTGGECPSLYPTPIIPNQRWVSIPLLSPDHSQPSVSVCAFTQPWSFPTGGVCPSLTQPQSFPIDGECPSLYPTLTILNNGSGIRIEEILHRSPTYDPHPHPHLIRGTPQHGTSLLYFARINVEVDHWWDKLIRT